MYGCIILAQYSDVTWALDGCIVWYYLGSVPSIRLNVHTNSSSSTLGVKRNTVGILSCCMPQCCFQHNQRQEVRCHRWKKPGGRCTEGQQANYCAAPALPLNTNTFIWILQWQNSFFNLLCCFLLLLCVFLMVEKFFEDIWTICTITSYVTHGRNCGKDNSLPIHF